MADEEQRDPMWKPGDLQPFQAAVITLDSATEIADGENKFGKWTMWPVKVENAKVYERESNKAVEGYSGGAICFPSEKLHKQLMEHTGGTKEGVRVEVKMVPKKNRRGSLYTTYETKVVEDGVTPSSNLMVSQHKFIEDFKKFVESKVIVGTKEDFINFGTTQTYNIPIETLETLWNVYNEGK